MRPEFSRLMQLPTAGGVAVAIILRRLLYSDTIELVATNHAGTQTWRRRVRRPIQPATHVAHAPDACYSPTVADACAAGDAFDALIGVGIGPTRIACLIARWDCVQSVTGRRQVGE